MTHFENLKKSLEALTIKNAVLVKSLTMITQKKEELDFSFENTERGELNLIYQTKPPFTLHNPKGALKSETPWIQSLSPQKQILFIFGTGLGYSYILLKKWLAQKQSYKVVYIEPHLGVLFHLFQTEVGKQMAEDPQVQFYTFQEKNDLSYLIHYLGIYFCQYTIEITSLPSYEKTYPDLSSYIQGELRHVHLMATTRISESKTSFKYALRNTLSKIPNLSGNVNASLLHNAFSQIPCIIVGAGPSLKKNQHILKSLRQKAIILAGSSAIPASNHVGIEPHFGTYLDPYARVHERFLKTTSFEMPSFHSARAYYETSNSLHGPKLYLKSSDEFPYINWLEDQVGFYGPVTHSYISVTTFNTSIALLLGCNPIIYVGVDLAYTNNESYSSGVEKNFAAEKKPLEASEDFQVNQNVWDKDIFNQPILTKQAWQVESHFLSEIFQGHPRHQFINATEGGLGFKGAENMALNEVKEKYLSQSFAIDEWSHSESIQHLVENESIPKIAKKSFKELTQSFKRVQKVYQSVLKEIKILQKKNAKEELNSIDETFIYEAQVKISNEIAYQYLLTHQHQIIDAENLKTHSLYHFIPSNAPVTFKNRIQLERLFSRFNSYYQNTLLLLPLLEQSLNEA